MWQISDNLKIVFVGGGNMGQALVSGLLNSGWLGENITIIDTDQALCAKLKKIFTRCNIFSQANDALDDADILVLAVKPQTMQLACEPIAAPCQSKRPLIISIAAGMLINDIDTWLGGELPIVRCMPNMPALVQSGTSGLYANARISDTQREIAQGVLNCVGSTLWVEQESMLDVVTAISGSGPAYFFYLIETMLTTGHRLGLSEEHVRQLTIDTAAGAVKLIRESGKTAQELRRAVTSKGGTTEAAIETLEQDDVKNSIDRAITNAARRAQQLTCANSHYVANPASKNRGE